MKNLWITTTAIILLSSSLYGAGNAAGTSTARLDALGLSNTQTEDYSNIFANPSLLVGYSNEAYMESLNQSTSGFGGASYDLLGGVVAVFFNRTASRVASSEATLFNQNIATGFAVHNDGVNGTSFSAGGGYVVAINPNVQPQNSVDVLYAMPLGKSMDIGVRTFYAVTASTSTDLSTSAVDTESVSEFEVEAGVNLKSLNLDISATYSMISLDASATDSNLSYASNAASSISVSVRQKRDIGKNTKLTTVLFYGKDTFNFKNVLSTTQTESRDDVTSDLSATTTLKYEISDDTAGYASIGAKMLSYSDGFNDGLSPSTLAADLITMTLVPVVVGVEAQTSEAWSFRGSISSYLYATATQKLSNTDTAGAVTGTQDTLAGATSTVNLNAGATYLVGGFRLDGVLSSGTYFTGKNNVLDSVLGKFTVSYKF